MDRATALPTRNRKTPKSKRWVQFHLKYASPSTYDTGFVWDRSRWAEGPFCMDPDGNIVLDFISHVGASPLGYNDPELMEFMREQKWADPDRYAGCDFIQAYGEKPDKQFPTPAHLHQKVHEITKHMGFNQAFFTNSGAEAVENAIKICYHARRQYGYGFSFMDAFHGRTLGVLSLNRSKVEQRRWYPQVPKIHSLPFCSCTAECSCGWKLVGRDGQPINALAHTLDKQLGLIDPREVAYIILEPVQGEGGYNFPNKRFIKEVFTTAKEHNIPVIADEVQSGMGKTGKWWAIEHFKQKPDVIATAKAMRIGATISSKRVFPQESGRISSTWGEGNALASAMAYKTIDLIQRRKLLDNARKQGRYLLKRLKEVEKYPFVSAARGLGLMAAITIDTTKRRDSIKDHALKNGVLFHGAGYRSIRFLPPLNVTRREIDLAMDALDRACKAKQ